MRSPNTKMVQYYNNFKLGKKDGDAQMVIESQNSSMGEKGQLQQAQFKVSGIRVDYRGIRTIAKVGGLVGKNRCYR